MCPRHEADPFKTLKNNAVIGRSVITWTFSYDDEIAWHHYLTRDLIFLRIENLPGADRCIRLTPTNPTLEIRTWGNHFLPAVVRMGFCRAAGENMKKVE